MLRRTPFLLFDGNCAETMTFCHRCLGGELRLTRFADTPMKDLLPKEKWDRLINANLKSGEIEISATDWMTSPQYEPKQGDTYAKFIIGGAYEELDAVFDMLKVGEHADRFQELHDLPLGTYGQFFDRYGVH